MDLQPRKTVFTPTDDKAWLASNHGTDAPISITLDIEGGSFDDLFEQNGYDKYLPSGVPVKKGAGTLYVLATGAGNAAAGHTLERVLVHADSKAAGAALHWHGVVRTAQVPGTFIEANKVASGQIKYV